MPETIAEALFMPGGDRRGPLGKGGATDRAIDTKESLAGELEVRQLQAQEVFVNALTAIPKSSINGRYPAAQSNVTSVVRQ